MSAIIKDIFFGHTEHRSYYPSRRRKHAYKTFYAASTDDMLKYGFCLVICMMSAASLSFLGLGVQAPTPEWGAIISSGKDFLGTAWWITVIPGLVLAFTGWGFSMIGDGLSDMLRARGK